MNIRKKITLGFLLIALLVPVAGYLSIMKSEVVLEEAIGRDFFVLSKETMNKIDRSIYNRMEEFAIYARQPEVLSALRSSNENFTSLEDPAAYIQEQDVRWRALPANESNELMDTLLRHELSLSLRDRLRFYKALYGYQVYGEVFLTNAYGANVAQTGRTSDYKQDDEEWWQQSVSEGAHISDFSFDESAGVHSVSISYRIDDTDDTFLGVMKVVVNIEEVTTVLEQLIAQKRKVGFDTIEFQLLSRDGSIIYNSDGENTIHDRHQRGDWRENNYNIHRDHDGAEKLVTYSDSEGINQFPGLGWSLILSIETNDIFAPIKKIHRDAFFFSLSTAALAILIAIVLSNSFSQRITRLQKVANQIGKGNFDVAIDVSSEDEIGRLADSLRHMRVHLQESKKKLSNFNEHLEVKVRERTNEVEKEKEKVSELLAAKSKFVNQVAHDLRTPLVPIMGLLPILKKDLEKGASKNNNKIIDTISNNAKYLHALVGDTLSVAQLDSGKLRLHMRPEDIHSIVSEVIEDNAIVFKKEGISIVQNISENLPRIFADRIRIIEVLENLVSNAIKFMKTEKTLTFTATAEKHFVVVTVSDSGIGVRKEDMSKIFEEFQKVDSSRHLTSSGLGLSICKRIVKKHGGKIWVESPGSGKGTAFTFTLPIHKGAFAEEKRDHERRM
ncbi:MAG: sensor histidine kinase [Candidatus Woesearchaeota archaeon]|nr:sensor histidine kinase [Candidatus Woesearchaeota archaeon]